MGWWCVGVACWWLSWWFGSSHSTGRGLMRILQLNNCLAATRGEREEEIKRRVLYSHAASSWCGCGVPCIPQLLQIWQKVLERWCNYEVIGLATGGNLAHQRGRGRVIPAHRNSVAIANELKPKVKHTLYNTYHLRYHRDWLLCIERYAILLRYASVYVCLHNSCYQISVEDLGCC